MSKLFRLVLAMSIAAASGTCVSAAQKVAQGERAVVQKPVTASKETYEGDRAWTKELETGACSRIGNRGSEKEGDGTECERLYARQPLCMSYAAFAHVWFDIANQDLPDFPIADRIKMQTRVLEEMGTKPAPNHPEYYTSAEYRQMMRQLLRVIFSQQRFAWKTVENAERAAYKECMEGHPF
jgi:hypothetical protein